MLRDEARVEHGSIHQKPLQYNECTGTFFRLQHRSHFICNALKSGSTSWQVQYYTVQYSTVRYSTVQLHLLAGVLRGEPDQHDPHR